MLDIKSWCTQLIKKRKENAQKVFTNYGRKNLNKRKTYST